MRSRIAVFCVLVFGLAALNLAAPGRVYSEFERRYLAQAPAFSASALFAGQYLPALEKWLTDQFVARDAWVGAKTVAERALGRRETNGVYFAADDYYIEAFRTPDRFFENLARLAEFESDLALPVKTLLIPTASHVYREKLPAFAPETDQAALLRAARDTLSDCVDVSPILCAHADEYLYYRNDHHWTTRAATYAEAALFGSTSAVTEETLSASFLGTTYAKAHPLRPVPDVVTAALPQNKVEVTYPDGRVSSSCLARRHRSGGDPYATFLDGNQSLLHITSDAAGGRVLILKDSYANCLVPLLAAHYAELYVMDLRYYKAPLHSFLEEHPVDSVLVIFNLKSFASDNTLWMLKTAVT